MNESCVQQMYKITEKINFSLIKIGGRPVRVGIGYDVHKLTENRKLILGGIEIPYEKGLMGHSDADVLIHAIMDALLGAAAKGDIGKNFPDNDEKYKDISSMILLKRVKDILNEDGYTVVNIDSTIVAQRPKLASYIDSMRKNIAEVLEIEIEQINIKATTEEGLGFTGEGKGISAYAICMLKNESSFPLKSKTCSDKIKILYFKILLFLENLIYYKALANCIYG